GAARVVELQQEAAVDDHLVFGAHCRRDCHLQVIVAFVVFVLAIGNDTGRRRDRQEGFLYFRDLQSRFEVVDVALQLSPTRVFDWTSADRFGGGGDGLFCIKLGVEFGKLSAVGAALEWIRNTLPNWAALKPGQSLEGVLRPADRLAEFAVTDDVDAGLRLMFHDLIYGFRKADLVGFLLERPASLLCAQELLQRVGPDQAADMRCQNAFGAAFHSALYACGTRGRQCMGSRPISSNPDSA